MGLYLTGHLLRFLKRPIRFDYRCSVRRWSNAGGQPRFSLAALSAGAFIVSCAPAARLVLPPDNYRGPRAEQPVLQAGDYWVFEAGDATRQKAIGLYPNLEFPLWVGKTWSYESEARRANLPPNSTASPLRTRIDCYVDRFDQVVVRAGFFSAFQCDCQCHLLTGIGQYEDGCGDWTLWYAPDVKNIIKRKTDSTATSLEIIEYRGLRRPTPRTNTSQREVMAPAVETE
jgi:hypothetical protein